MNSSEIFRAPAGPPSPISDHVPAIDGLRAIAALWVFVHHAAQTAPFPWTDTLLFGWIGRGRYAVAIFLVISGYCLTKPLVHRGFVLRNGIADFCRRRIRRILPPFYLALVLSALLAGTVLSVKQGTIWDASAGLTIATFLMHVGLIHNLFGSAMYAINYPLWSIAVECQLYLLFPLLLLGWRKLGGAFTTVAAVVIGWTIYLLVKGLDVAGLTAHFLGLFAFGMAGAMISSRENEIIRFRWQGFGWVLLAAVIVLHYVSASLASHYELMDLLVGGTAGVVMVAASKDRRSLFARLLGSPLLVWIGTFSYSFYLLHAPLLELVYRALRWVNITGPLAFPTLLLVGLPITVGSAYGFFLLAEKPFLRTNRTTVAPVAAEPLTV